MKIAAIVAGIVVVIIIGVAILLMRNLDSIVADAIETYGSQATGTAVSVDSVKIELREGRGTVRGLSVANPEGFAEPNALTWGEVTIDIDPASVTSPPYVVDEVRVEAPIASLVINERGEMNLREIQQRLQRGQKAGKEGGQKAGQQEEAGSSGESPRLKIRSFAFERGEVQVHTAEVGGKDVRVDLPPLVLKNLGGRDGATATEIGRQILTAYTEQILRTVAKREIGSRVEGAIDEQLGEGAGKAATGLLDRLQGR